MRTPTRLLVTVALLGAASGCARPEPAPSPKLAADPVDQAADALGPEIAGCASGGWASLTKTLTLKLTGATCVLAAPGGTVTANGIACLDANGGELTTSLVQKIVVNGDDGGASVDDDLILDLQQGPFGTRILSAAGGITANLGKGADTFQIRGSTGKDKVTVGSVGADTYFEISGDRTADLKIVAATPTFVVSLSDGADWFDASGTPAKITGFAGKAITVTPLVVPITVYGGEGADTIQGGAKDDVLNGGPGDDVFTTGATPDGADTYNGDEGSDTVDYSARLANLTVTVGSGADDGEPGENDDVTATVENVTGGKGDDTLTGDDQRNVLLGGAGNDTLAGGPNASCVDATTGDVLNGGAGDDVFDLGQVDCWAVVIGGAGTDTADFSARGVSLSISLDGLANDGAKDESANVGADVEIVRGGAGDDVIVGSAKADRLEGGPGDDVLSGLAGDDVLLGGPGADVLNGGAGTDLVDYSSAQAGLVVTLCDDPKEPSGAPTSPAQSGVGCPKADDGEVGEGDQVVNCEWIKGGAGSDALTADPLSTTGAILEGGDGGDVLTGGPGNDHLYGDDGDDTLVGGGGDDYLEGCAGNDSMDGGASDGDICVADASDGSPPLACEL